MIAGVAAAWMVATVVAWWGIRALVCAAWRVDASQRGVLRRAWQRLPQRRREALRLYTRSASIRTRCWWHGIDVAPRAR